MKLDIKARSHKIGFPRDLIMTAKLGDGFKCVIAEDVMRRLGTSCTVVTKESAKFTKDGVRYVYPLSYKARKFVAEFDSIKSSPIEEHTKLRSILADKWSNETFNLDARQATTAISVVGAKKRNGKPRKSPTKVVREFSGRNCDRRRTHVIVASK